MMKKLCPVGESTKKKLAKNMGHKSQVAIVNHLKAAMVLGLIEESNGGVVLSETGKQFCSGKKEQLEIMRGFLTDKEKGIGQLTDAFRVEGPTITRKQFRDCIRLFVDSKHDAASLVNSLGGWYEDVGFVKFSKDHIHSFLSASQIPMKLDALFSKNSIDVWLYTHLVESEFGKKGSTSPLSYEQIVNAYVEFKGSTPDSAEEPMMIFLSRACQILGFLTQHVDGPRDQGKLKFGSEGDDFLLLFPVLNPISPSEIGGIAFASELKRSIANKKAVGQALTFSDVVREVAPTYFVMPLVISDSSQYCDDVALKYAESSNVIHIPLEFFRKIVDLQLERYLNGKELISPLDVTRLLIQLHTDRNVEPRLPDLISYF
jgi:hypothetical protein